MTMLAVLRIAAALAVTLPATALGATVLWHQYGSSPAIRYDAPAQVISTSGSTSSYVRVQAGAYPNNSSLELAAPPGTTLVPGAYESASRYPFNGNGPGLDLSVGSSGCNTVLGRFVVLEAVFDGNELIRFAADFEQHCETFGTPTFGELRINSTLPLTIDKPPGSTTPDAMRFLPRTWAALGAPVLSNRTTVYGINTSLPVSITGGEYSINGLGYTSAAGTVVNGDSIRVLATAPATANSTSTATLHVGGIDVPFPVSTFTTGVPATGVRIEGGPNLMAVAPDWRITPQHYEFRSMRTQLQGPDGSFYFISLLAPQGATLDVGAYEMVTGYNPGGPAAGLDIVSCTTSYGRFVVLERQFNLDGTVARFAANLLQECSGSGPIYAEVRINSAIPFTYQKPSGSTTPDPFAFAPVAPAMPGSLVESDPTVVFGITSPAPISVTGGAYSIDGGAYTTGPGFIGPRSRVRVRATASATAGAVTTARLTIGGVSADFSVTTYESSTPLSAIFLDSAPGDWLNRDFQVEGFAPQWSFDPAGSTPSNVQLNIRGAGWTYYTLTLGAPPGTVLGIGAYEMAARTPFRGTSPGLDFFGNGSGCNTVSGRFVILDIAFGMDGTLSKLAVNFEQWCGVGSLPLYGEVRFNSGVPLSAFKPAGTSLPDPFAFIPQDPVLPGVSLTSNVTTIYGINTQVPISIVGGEYSLNGAPFTSAPGTARNLDDVIVRMTSATAPGAARSTTFTAGGRSATFSARTYSPGTVLTGLALRTVPGDSWGGGAVRTYLGADARIEAFNSLSNVADLHVIAPNGDSWFVTIASPAGTPLVPGMYLDAQDVTINSPRPYLRFYGNGAACSLVSGRFVIHEVERASNGTLQRFAADFEYGCSGLTQPVFGEVRMASTVPLAMFAPGRKRPFDLNGDRRADIAWQSGDGSVAAWTMQGAARISESVLIAPATGWTLAHHGDFNGDGKSDLLWTHTDGRSATWLMDGLAQAGGGALLGPATGWRPVLVADFNGDGKADIVWQHTDGRTAMWLMNGATQAGGTALIGAGTGWIPRLAGDFNGDGRADLVWAHPDGRVAMWLMNGSTQVGGAALIGAGTGWQARLAADFDGDGKSDLLWEHADGRSAMWLMDGATQAGGALLLGAGTGYAALRTGDVNGDGKADIVWQRNTGLTAYWLMDGVRQLGGARLLDAGSGWTITRFADFTGEGRADYLATHSDGRVRMGLNHGLGFNTVVPLSVTGGLAPLPLAP